MTFETRHVVLLIAAVAAMPVAASANENSSTDPAAIEFFEKKIRPLLAENCFNCHSANTNAKGGLRLDDRNGFLNGGNGGPAIVPGRPKESLLIKAVGYSDDVRMPPDKRLSAEEIADLTKWIADGAAWPAVEVPVDLGASHEDYERLKKKHWAWQPLRAMAVPAVDDATWPRDDVDRFVLSRLEREGLAPVGDADRTDLIRRVAFDLTGLPPSPEEIDAFVSDESTDAFEKVVDRLLSSPAFGERWGRHWLDVARYGESTGSSRNVPYPHAWRYRDYVVDALNTDKPYDEFLREQIAGDLLPYDSQAERDEHLIATGFLALGVKDVNQRFKVRFEMDNVDEQIDTVTRSVLGLTASCARCHDHKFDPIPATDYYALAGIFTSTDLCAGVRSRMGGGGLDYYDTDRLLSISGRTEGASASAEEIEKAKQVVAEAKAKFQALRNSPEGAALAPNGRPKRQVARQKWNKAQADLLALTDPAANGNVAFGVRDAATIGDTPLRIRGEAEQLGPVVPRGYLSAVEVPGVSPVNTNQSGRLELAGWLASENNPLTSRVVTNRIWHHLFGQGLVRTVDNFGVTGDEPSHPKLLDHLAARFVADGWSVKKLVRTLVLTRTYQLAAESTAAHLAADPANRLLWRHAPRRLDAEEIRDAMLAAAGALDASRPEGSAARELKVMEMRNNGPESARLADAAAAARYRSVYLPLVRGVTPRSLAVFDFAEQGMVTGDRDTTTVAPQALYLLNDPFVRRQSLSLAERVLEFDDEDDAARLDRLYRRTFGRKPTPVEVSRALAYLADYELAYATIPREAVLSPVEAPRPVGPVEVAAADGTGAEEEVSKKPLPPPNPDDVEQADAATAQDSVIPSDARIAAWASLSQALLGTAEFRYLQ